MEQKATGFASPAQGYEEQGIDLNRLLIQNPPASYFCRIDSDELEEVGLFRGTLIIVDRSADPLPGNFVLLRHEGQFLCRLMTEEKGKTVFSGGKEIIRPINDETEIIGTVTASIRQYE